jgi:hypothetical protein
MHRTNCHATRVCRQLRRETRPTDSCRPTFVPMITIPQHHQAHACESIILGLGHHERAGPDEPETRIRYFRQDRGMRARVVSSSGSRRLPSLKARDKRLGRTLGLQTRPGSRCYVVSAALGCDCGRVTDWREGTATRRAQSLSARRVIR